MEKALKSRRTIRRFANKALTQAQLSQLLWAAYGVTDSRGLKSAPSAGALYPLDIYVVVGERQVSDLASGVYHYLPEKQALESRRIRGCAKSCSSCQYLSELDGGSTGYDRHHRGIPALPN